MNANDQGVIALVARISHTNYGMLPDALSRRLTGSRSLYILSRKRPSQSLWDIWEKYVEQTLLKELKQIDPKRHCFPEFMHAGWTEDDAQKTAAVLLRCRSKPTETSVRSYVDRTEWLKGAARDYGFAIFVYKSKYGPNSDRILEDIFIAIAAEDTTVQLRLPLSADSLLGQPITLTRAGSLDHDLCTLGGAITIGSRTYGLVALHGFEAVSGGASTTESDSSDDEPYAYNLSTPSHLVRANADKNLVLPAAHSNTATRIHVEPAKTKVTDHLADATYIAARLTVLAPPRQAENDGEDSAAGSEISEFSDWALVDVSRLPTQIQDLATSNRFGNIIVRDLWSEPAYASGVAAIGLAAKPFTTGILSDRLVSFPVHGRLLRVQTIDLEYPLPLGSSGAWVVVDGLLAGFIVGTVGDTLRAYVVPIQTLLKELRSLFGALRIGIPHVKPETTIASAQSDSEVPENERNSLISGKPIPDLEQPAPTLGVTPLLSSKNKNPSLGHESTDLVSLNKRNPSRGIVSHLRKAFRAETIIQPLKGGSSSQLPAMREKTIQVGRTTTWRDRLFQKLGGRKSGLMETTSMAAGIAVTHSEPSSDTTTIRPLNNASGKGKEGTKTILGHEGPSYHRNPEATYEPISRAGSPPRASNDDYHRSSTVGRLPNSKDLPSTGRDKIDQLSAREKDHVWTSVMPPPLECTLRVSLASLARDSTLRISKLDWSERTVSKALQDMIDKDIFRPSVEGFYDSVVFALKKGFLHLEALDAKTKSLPRSFIALDQLDQLLVAAVFAYAHNHPRVPFQLNMHLEYITVRTGGWEGISMVDGIRYELLNHLRYNFERQQFIPRTVVRELTRRTVVEEVLQSNGTLADLSSHGKHQLALQVTERASGLFLASIYRRVPLTFLHHLIDYHQLDDACESERSLSNGSVECKAQRAHDLETAELLSAMWHFSAPVIRSSDATSVKVLSKNEVMPVMFVGTDHHIGEGAYGSVHHVSVDSAHFDIPGYDPQHLALKMFRPMNRHADGPFENEVKVLRNLAAYPHPHIVASLASWASDDMRYILYPLAKGNLRSLFSQPPPAFDAAGIMWLLRQLEGLAGAVGHVHNMGNLGTGRKIRSKIGFHHDIKPENILLFEDVENLEMPKLMLTDFGSGRVNEDSPDNLSHKTDNYRGTLTYAGPDMHMYGHVSRPFDMWALGCVFLEVLIWMCVPGADQAVEEHARMRLDDPELPTGRGAMDDTYWYKSFQSSGPTYRLKPSVLYAFSSLEDHCHGMEVFQSVLRLVKRLLVIDPPARLKARDLEYELHLLKEKAKMELERDAELDLRLANKSRGIGIGDASGKAPRLVLSLRPSRIPLPPSPVGSFPSTISLSEDSEDSMPELLIRPPSPRAVLLERRHRFSTDSLLEINAEREG